MSCIAPPTHERNLYIQIMKRMNMHLTWLKKYFAHVIILRLLRCGHCRGLYGCVDIIASVIISRMQCDHSSDRHDRPKGARPPELEEARSSLLRTLRRSQLCDALTFPRSVKLMLDLCPLGL